MKIQDEIKMLIKLRKCTKRKYNNIQCDSYE